MGREPIPEKFQLAMNHLMRNHYTNLMSLGISLVVTRDVPTLAVDQWGRLYINPDFCEPCTIPELAGVIFHELLHLALSHPQRGEQIRRVYQLPASCTAATLLNVAADLSINPLLREFGFQLPGKCAFPELFGWPHGESMEDYFRRLYENCSKSAQENSASPFPNPTEQGEQNKESQELQGEKEGEEEGELQGELQGEKEGEKEGERRASQEPGTPSFGGGSGSHGIPQPWELPPDHPSYPAPSPTSQINTKKEIARAIQKIQHQKAIGHLPDPIQRVLAELLAEPSRTNWRQLLRAALHEGLTTKKGWGQRTFRKPRRFATPDPKLILPSTTQPQFKIAVVVDTSGSVEEEELRDALLAIWHIAKSFEGSEILVLTGDTETHARRTLRTSTLAEVARIERIGGGGTNMNTLIADAAREKPHAVVVLTDGYTPWASQSPAGKIPVLVALLGENPDPNTPSWVHKTVKLFRGKNV